MSNNISFEEIKNPKIVNQMKENLIAVNEEMVSHSNAIKDTSLIANAFYRAVANSSNVVEMYAILELSLNELQETQF